MAIHNHMCEVNDPSSVLDVNQIPKGINIAVIAGQNISVPWMTNCCAPSPVKKVPGESCYMWCEIPSRYTQVADAESLITTFESCVARNSLDAANLSLTASIRLNAATRQTKPMMGLILISALLFAGMIGAGL
jgi:hypothetical protein